MYRLPPLVHPLPSAFLARPDVIEAVVDRFGSPVNVVFPQVFTDNLAGFQALLHNLGLSYRICYAHKANQARAFATAAHRAGIDIDIASPGELANAVAAGFAANRIEATGPKGEPFLRTLIAAGVTINVDNLWELGKIRELTGQRSGDTRTPVLLRVAGATSGDRPASRFGIAHVDSGQALAILTERDSPIELRGFSFHLDSSDTAERVRAVAGCLHLVEQAYACGLQPRVLDIGGGFRQAFSADPVQFDGYVQALKRGLRFDGESLVWGRHTFGYRREAGLVTGTPNFHKYGGDTAGVALLAEVLASPLDGQRVSATLRDVLLELWIEPGKALVDHAGLTIATVEFTKQLADGTTLVNLDISRDAITPADQEVMLDPVVIFRRPPAVYRDKPGGVFLAGHLCLERDMVFNHKLFLDRLPQPGDRVIFTNTAAYQMDLSAAKPLMHNALKKVVAVRDGDTFVVNDDATSDG